MSDPSTTSPHFDVIVVGAGLSGIGAGYHLQSECPDRSYTILEGRDALGGTWDLFRYPGVRSDSDMHTLGFSFKPWTNAKSIADGPSILAYLQETAQEFGIDKKIQYGHLVTNASWSSESASWTVTATTATETRTLTCNFLFMCSGYYSYKGGYTPEFAGRETFAGQIVHPQKWPEDLDYQNKQVVVIGSGATAMTLVPAMARHAAQVTMLQRSPTYVVSRPDEDPFANRLNKVLPSKLAYDIIRLKNMTRQQMIYKKTRTDPDKVRTMLLDLVSDELDPDYVEQHFTPSYNPWDQRMCLIPNSDLFQAIKWNKANVVTAQIDTFTPNGIRLTSGEELPADIIVTATGLNLVTLGDMDFQVDGRTVDFSQTWTYKGLSYSDVPNLVSTFGYINASWTLRADLTCGFVCRLLNHMKETGTVQCTPRLRPEDMSMPANPWIQDFPAGYMNRMMPLLPKQGDREPWLNPQNFTKDKKMINKAPLDDGVMIFTRAQQPATVAT